MNKSYFIALPLILIVVFVIEYLLFALVAPVTEAWWLERAGQLMSGILIASTALMGIGAIFLLQIRFSSKEVFTGLRQTTFRWYSALSMILGVATIIFILCWLIFNYRPFVYVTWALFINQIGLVNLCAFRIGFYK